MRSKAVWSRSRKRGAASYTNSQRLRRLIRGLSEREAWKETFDQIRTMRQWMMQAEHIFDGSWASTEEEITQAAVGEQLDRWLQRLRTYMSTLEPSQRLFQGLSPLLGTLSHLRPHPVC